MVSRHEIEKWLELQEDLKIKVQEIELPGFLELTDEILPFEIPQTKLKNTYKTSIVESGPAFHTKIAKNQKVNVRRNIEKEKKLKYGKAYKKEKKQ